MKIKKKNLADRESNPSSSQTPAIFWRNTLEDVPMSTEIYSDFKRPVGESSKKATFTFKISNTLLRDAAKVAQNQGVSSEVFFMTVFQVLISRYKSGRRGEGHVVVGLSTTCKDQSAKTGDYFCNILPIVSSVSENPKFSDFLKDVDHKTLKAVENGSLPYHEIMETIKSSNDLNHSLCSQVLFKVIENCDFGSEPNIKFYDGAVAFDLALVLSCKDDFMNGQFWYSSELFRDSTIEEMAKCYTHLLECILGSPHKEIFSYNLVPHAETERILKLWNATEEEFQHSICVDGLIEKAIKDYPEHIAIESGDRKLTYKELDVRSSRVASELVRRGVKPNDLVGIHLDRNENLVVAILGVLKAGGAYLPLDPNFPADRIQFMVEDTQCSLILSQKDYRTDFSVCSVSVLDIEVILEETSTIENTSYNKNPEDYAYVIYTSGSTGRPKGVPICHRSVVNFLSSFKRKLQFGPSDSFLALATLSFDPSVLELFLPLMCGGRVIMATRDHSVDPFKLMPLIKKTQPKFMQATPTGWKLLIKSGWEGQADLNILTGGEALTNELAESLIKRCKNLWHVYGPTETTVWATICLLKSSRSPLSIGKPVGNQKIYIVDPKYHGLLPIGAVGELCISGIGVSAGYINRPELNHEKFIPDPFSFNKQQFMYKTGDLARFLPTGDIEFIGRADSQVKIRGFRIEPGEIENVLSGCTGISQAAVVVRSDVSGEPKLIAYFTLNEASDLPVETIRDSLRKILPDYMIPHHFIKMEALPRTPTGKVDRRALPDFESSQSGSSVLLKTKNEFEEKCLKLWCETLKKENISVADNFFSLGGDSLLALDIIMKARKVFNCDIPVVALLQSLTLEKFAESVKLHCEKENSSLLSAGEEGSRIDFDPSLIPLTDLQEAYWIGQKDFYDGNSPAIDYFEYTIKYLDVEKYNKALNKLIERHELLRAFVSDGRLALLSRQNYQALFENISSFSAKEKAEYILKNRKEMISKSPDLETWPLFEIKVLQISEMDFKVCVCMSLLIADGKSFDIFRSELNQFYKNEKYNPSELETSFADFVREAKQRETSDSFQKSQKYWMDRIETLPAAPELPVSSAGLQKASLFERHSCKLVKEKWAALQAIARSYGVTPSSVFCYLYAEVLGRWSKTKQFSLNIVGSERKSSRHKLDALFGNFSSTVLLKAEVDKNISFVENTKILQNQLWSDLAHSNFTGVRFIRELAKRRGGESAPFGPVVFTSMIGVEKDDELFPYSFDFQYASTPQVWLSYELSERNGELFIDWYAKENLFPPGLVAEIFEVYKQAAESLCVSKENWQQVRMSTLPAAQEKIIERANNTHRKFPKGRLEQLVLQNSHAKSALPAIITKNKLISHEELTILVHNLSLKLLSVGVKRGHKVCIFMEKGWEQVVAALAILKVGGVYVPVDGNLPAERVRFLLNDAEAKAVLTQTRTQSLNYIEGIPAVVVDASLGDGGVKRNLPEVNFSDTDLAYIIYTSGSTGQPKGVMIDHLGAVNTIHDINNRFDIRSNDRVLALSSFSFDLSVYDVFGILGRGGALVFPEVNQMLNPEAWLEYVEKHQVTIWNTVPAFMKIMVEYLRMNSKQLPSCLRVVMMSGDWIPVELPNEIRSFSSNPAIRITSLGGATEASIWSIYYDIEEVDPSWKSIPYGKPMDNQTFHVLDTSLESCPVYGVGDLYIGGIGLAKGYWKREDLTNKAFIKHPILGPLYRTGDLGRYLEDGNIEFLGRADFQVKINGYRVELGEIESAINSYIGIAASVAKVIKKNGSNKIAVYILEDHGQGEKFNFESLKVYLEKKLPTYMVPQHMMFLKTFPLNSNGKVDREKLPLPDAAIVKANVSASNEVESKLANLWKKILDLSEVSSTVDFFEVGGNSLQAVRLTSQIRKEFDIKIPLESLFEHRTIQQLGILIERMSGKEGGKDLRVSSQVVKIKSGESRIPFFLIHPIGGNIFSYAELAKNLTSGQEVYGLQARGLDGLTLPHSSIEEMAASYTQLILETHPSGPYMVGGWSFGGVIAIEVSRKLKELQKEVAPVIVIDSYLPSAYEGSEADSSIHDFFRDLFQLHGAENNLDGAPGSTLNEITQYAKEKGLIPKELDIEKIESLFKVYRANCKILTNYKPRPYTDDAIFLRASKGRRIERFMEWKSYFPLGFKIYSLHGTHYSILEQPGVGNLCRIVDEETRRMLSESFKKAV